MKKLRVKIKHNNHEISILSCRDDEGEYSIPGRSFLLKRGNYGLLVSWVQEYFEVIPVSLTEKEGEITIHCIEEEKRWRGDITVAYGKDAVYFDGEGNIFPPTSVIFTPPEGVSTDEKNEKSAEKNTRNLIPTRMMR